MDVDDDGTGSRLEPAGRTPTSRHGGMRSGNQRTALPRRLRTFGITLSRTKAGRGDVRFNAHPADAAAAAVTAAPVAEPTAEQAMQQAEDEGLSLVRASNPTGLQGITSGSRPGLEVGAELLASGLSTGAIAAGSASGGTLSAARARS